MDFDRLCKNILGVEPILSADCNLLNVALTASELRKVVHIGFK